jgi:hypothetical protein
VPTLKECINELIITTKTTSLLLVPAMQNLSGGVGNVS